MIQINHVNYSYDGIHPVLNDIDHVIATGAKIAIVGQNGSGKTTLAKNINHLCQPQSGTVIIDGQSTQNATIAQVSKQVGYIFQNPNDQLFNNSVEKEIQYALLRQKLSEAEIQKRTQTALELCQLTSLAKQHPYDLAITTRKFVCIAAIIAMHPNTIILDEPTAGLDQKERTLLAHILDVLHHQQITTLTITHDMDFVANEFEDILVMAHGQILFEGQPKDFFYDEKLLNEAQIEPPQIVRLMQALSIDQKIITIHQAQHYLQEVYR